MAHSVDQGQSGAEIWAERVAHPSIYLDTAPPGGHERRHKSVHALLVAVRAVLLMLRMLAGGGVGRRQGWLVSVVARSVRSSSAARLAHCSIRRAPPCMNVCRRGRQAIPECRLCGKQRESGRCKIRDHRCFEACAQQNSQRLHSLTHVRARAKSTLRILSFSLAALSSTHYHHRYKSSVYIPGPAFWPTTRELISSTARASASSRKMSSISS